MLRIKKNDTVIVLTGKDKGKRGTVLEIVLDKNLVKVKGIAVVTKHVKAKRQGENSGIVKQEGYINASNVMLVSPVDNQPCRVNFKTLEDGKKVRVSNRTQQTI
ncbi:50S ribosomal protein L24 [Candidatus Dependentiae bacterium]|nr:50S ribosomal protein L24 [Candidatus Dependentiae bacterium]